jgi:hypothetical protein
MNPKEVSLQHLYGYYQSSSVKDEKTADKAGDGSQQWCDGVLSSVLRRVATRNRLKTSWVVLDG